MERKQWLPGSFPFPEDKDRDGDDAYHQGCENFGFTPVARTAAAPCNGQGGENQREHGDDQNDADDIKLVEELDGELFGAHHLEGRSIRVKLAGFSGFATGPPQGAQQREGANGIDDAPHAYAPSPRGHREHGFRDVPADPSVDEKGECGNVGEEDTPAHGGGVGNDHFDQTKDAGVADLIQNGTSAKGFDAVGGRLDNCAQEIEEDADQHQLETTENVGDLGGGGLRGGSNHGSKDVDGGKQRVEAEGLGRVALVRIAGHPIETVGVGDDEETREKPYPVQCSELLRDGLRPSHTRRLGTQEGGSSVGSSTHLMIGAGAVPVAMGHDVVVVGADRHIRSIFVRSSFSLRSMSVQYPFQAGRGSFAKVGCLGGEQQAAVQRGQSRRREAADLVGAIRQEAGRSVSLRRGRRLYKSCRGGDEVAQWGGENSIIDQIRS